MFLDPHSFADWLTTKLTKPEALILFFQRGFYVSNSFDATQKTAPFAVSMQRRDSPCRILAPLARDVP
jgi:hypothetical protein